MDSLVLTLLLILHMYEKICKKGLPYTFNIPTLTIYNRIIFGHTYAERVLKFIAHIKRKVYSFEDMEFMSLIMWKTLYTNLVMYIHILLGSYTWDQPWPFLFFYNLKFSFLELKEFCWHLLSIFLKLLHMYILCFNG